MRKFIWGCIIVAAVVGAATNFMPESELSGAVVQNGEVMISLSSIGKVISWLWAIAFIPLGILSFAAFGLAFGGSDAAIVWGSVVWVLSGMWVAFHIFKSVVGAFV